MRSEPVLDILEQMGALDVDDRAKALFRRLVVDISLAHGISKVDRTQRVAYARRLLDARVSRATIRDRIMARYAVSRRQAYRLIDEALNCAKSGPKLARVETTIHVSKSVRGVAHDNHHSDQEPGRVGGAEGGDRGVNEARRGRGAARRVSGHGARAAVGQHPAG